MKTIFIFIVSIFFVSLIVYLNINSDLIKNNMFIQNENISLYENTSNNITNNTTFYDNNSKNEELLENGSILENSYDDINESLGVCINCTSGNTQNLSNDPLFSEICDNHCPYENDIDDLCEECIVANEVYSFFINNSRLYYKLKSEIGSDCILYWNDLDSDINCFSKINLSKYSKNETNLIINYFTSKINIDLSIYNDFSLLEIKKFPDDCERINYNNFEKFGLLKMSDALAELYFMVNNNPEEAFIFFDSLKEEYSSIIKYYLIQINETEFRKDVIKVKDFFYYLLEIIELNPLRNKCLLYSSYKSDYENNNFLPYIYDKNDSLYYFNKDVSSEIYFYVINKTKYSNNLELNSLNAIKEKNINEYLDFLTKGELFEKEIK